MEILKNPMLLAKESLMGANSSWHQYFCSDTTVALGRVICGKPENAADAVRMLTELGGTTHRVLTAVALQAGKRRFGALSSSRVSFECMTGAQIREYVATGEPGQSRCLCCAGQGGSAHH